MVFYGAVGEGGGAQAVFVVGNGLLGACNDGAFKVGVAADRDVEAAVAGVDAGLLGDAGEVAIDFGMRQIAAGGTAAIAEGRHADADI